MKINNNNIILTTMFFVKNSSNLTYRIINITNTTDFYYSIINVLQSAESTRSRSSLRSKSFFVQNELNSNVTVMTHDLYSLTSYVQNLYYTTAE